MTTPRHDPRVLAAIAKGTTQIKCSHLAVWITKFGTALPVVFETAGAACERDGFCWEEKCCGKAPRLKDVMEKAAMYDDLKE